MRRLHIICLSLSLFFGGSAFSADTTCGSQACSESICSRSDVLVCSDWNDSDRDGWSYSPNVGTSGDVKPGLGHEGSPGWEHAIEPNTAVTVHYDLFHTPTDRLHARFAFKLSPNYRHAMACGLQKFFYMRMVDSGQVKFRIMLGLTQASQLGGNFSNLDDSVGVIGFDYPGHIVELPDQPGDVPILIYPDRWYSVEFMSEWRSATENTVKVWVDGALSFSRENYVAETWTPGLLFNNVQDTSWFGGVDSCNPIAEPQFVYKDNTVLSTEYIGPVESSQPAPTTDPATIGTPGVPESSAP